MMQGITKRVNGDTSVAMSSCYVGQATYYDYAAGGNGHCSFEGLNTEMLPMLNVAAASTLFYDSGARCGECYEVYGPSGNVTVMISDECPSTGNTMCSTDTAHFDLGSLSTFQNIAPVLMGYVDISFRKVSCPISVNLGVKLQTSSSKTWIGILVFAHKVGITKVEIQPVGDAWYEMSPSVYNYYHYDSSQGPSIIAPFNVRITSETEQIIQLEVSQLEPESIHMANEQFSDPEIGYGGSSSTPCSVPNK